MTFKLIEPLRDLFKDEVRNVGRELGLPEEMVGRHPFPGPGPRDPGARRRVARRRSRRCATPTRSTSKRSGRRGCTTTIWQAFAVFLPVRSVGVMGDYRTYDNVIALRAVTSTDGMTADWFPFPPEVLARISTRIINEVAGRESRGVRRELEAARDDRVGVTGPIDGFYRQHHVRHARGRASGRDVPIATSP